jgi:Holliday junction DNA helicase RuvB
MGDAFRPETFADFIGQAKPKKILEILVRAARKKGTSVPHVLLSAPPGLGKTTLARILSREMGSRLIEIVASHLQSPGELAMHLKGIREGDILFIDEIHGLPRSVEECLYSAMEEFRIAVPQQGFDSLMKQLGMAAKKPTVQMIDLPRFTVVGATTLSGLVSDPLRSRFIQHLQLEPYADADLATIVSNAASKMDFPIDPEMALRIARRSRETTRVAIGHVRWIAEYCEATDKAPNIEAIDEAFDLKDVDAQGLTKQDRSYLSALVEAGCPLGVGTLAASLNESKQTLEQAVEPFLMRRGLMQKTPRGRVALPKAAEWIGRRDAA